MNHKLSVSLTLVAAVSGLLISPSIAHAASISFSKSIPGPNQDNVDPTNFKLDFGLSKFNPNLGNLDKVIVDLSGIVKGDAEYENRDSSPSTITLNLEAKLTLTETTTNLELGFVKPVISVQRQVTAFDGIVDFAGTSGGKISGFVSDAQVTNEYIASDTLALFIGSGEIGLNLEAIGMSQASGSGNIATIFSTAAGGTATVTYIYSTSAVPEPLTILGAGTALGFGAFFKRKLAKNQPTSEH